MNACSFLKSGSLQKKKDKDKGKAAAVPLIYSRGFNIQLQLYPSVLSDACALVPQAFLKHAQEFS